MHVRPDNMLLAFHVSAQMSCSCYGYLPLPSVENTDLEKKKNPYLHFT